MSSKTSVAKKVKVIHYEKKFWAIPFCGTPPSKSTLSTLVKDKVTCKLCIHRAGLKISEVKNA